MGAEASEKAVRFHAASYARDQQAAIGAWVGFFSAASEVALTPSFELEFRRR
jgi:hypothetical protein